MRRTDLFLRIDLVLAAVIAAVAGAPAALRSVLALLALVAVLERVVRRRDRGAVDAVLVSVGGTVVSLILVGLLLDLVGLSLRPATWAVALGLLGAGGLVAAYRHGAAAAPAATPRAAPPAATAADADTADAPVGDPAASGSLARRLPPGLLRQLPWAAATAAVIVLAVGVSVHATDRAEVQPLQMAFGAATSTGVQVVVSSATAIGPLALQSESPDGSTQSFPLFTVPAGHPVTNVVTLPSTGRYKVNLTNPNQSEPLRTLTVDR